jgi:hypothetical protein
MVTAIAPAPPSPEVATDHREQLPAARTGDAPAHPTDASVTPIGTDTTGARRGRRFAGFAVTVLVIAVGVYALRGRLPAVGSVVDLLAAAQPLWVAAAVVATVVSLWAFALVQHGLVTDLGGNLSRGRSMVLTLTSGAISLALPGGSALGAGYTYRRLRRTGLSSADTGLSMVGSAGLLTGALLALYLAVTGPTLFGTLTAQFGGVTMTIAGLVSVVALGFGLHWLRTQGTTRVRAARHDQLALSTTSEVVPATGPAVRPVTRRRRATAAIAAGTRVLTGYLRDLRRAGASLPAATWRSGAMWAVVKWVADFAVLAAALLAVGAGVDLIAMASVYVGVQILRQIPLTPGGVGVIEAALLGGLIAAGVAAAPAAAAVVIYRGLTYWLTLAAGAVIALLVRGPSAPSSPHRGRRIARPLSVSAA